MEERVLPSNGITRLKVGFTWDGIEDVSNSLRSVQQIHTHYNWSCCAHTSRRSLAEPIEAEEIVLAY